MPQTAPLLHGGCSDVHTYASASMVAPWLNLCFGLVLAGSFFYLNRKMYSNSKRALAGLPGGSVVRLSAYVSFLQACSGWCVVWGVYKLFTVQSVAQDNGEDSSSDNDALLWQHAVAQGFVESYSIFLEVALCALLVSSSLGTYAFQRSLALATVAAIVTMIGNYVTADSDEGALLISYWYREAVTYDAIQNVVRGSLYALLAFYWSSNGVSDRTAVVPFASYLAGVYLFKSFGALLMLREEDGGVCVYDLATTAYFGGFAVAVFRAVSTDSAYWSQTKGRSGGNIHATGYLEQHRDYLIPVNELYLIKNLGSGGKGVVDLYAWQRRHVAVKRLLMPSLTRAVIQSFEEEVSVLAQMSHPNVVQFLGILVDPPRLGLVMEYCSGGDLFDALAAGQLRDPMAIARDIARGMVYLQSRPQPFIHRDLKSLNILLTEDHVAQISDFGECRDLRSCFNSHVHGTPAWAAPELLKREQLSLRTDVFSYGVILWELLSFHTPFIVVPPGTKPVKTSSSRGTRGGAEQPLLDDAGGTLQPEVVELSSMQLAIAYVAKRDCRPPIPIGAPEDIVGLMTRCWSTDAEERPPFHEILAELERIEIAPACFPYALPGGAGAEP